jgi:hypothetical protein
MLFITKGSRYQISSAYLASMVNLSYRLMRNVLVQPIDSSCLSYDPIGSQNLRKAGRNAILSRFFNIPRPRLSFDVDKELLKI